MYSSTLWYSGIFAAAATFDASRKERRKEQWERAIAEVREDLKRPMEGRQAVEVEEKGEEVLEQYQPFGALANEEQVEDTEEYSRDELPEEQPLDDLQPDEDVFHLLDPTKARPHFRVNAGQDLNENDVPPQSLWASDFAKEEAMRRRWSDKKMATVEKCIELLQLHLIRQIQFDGKTKEAAAAVSEDYAKHILQSPEALNEEIQDKREDLWHIKEAAYDFSDYVPRHVERGQRLCSYTQDDLGNFHVTAQEMNFSLQRLFRYHNRDQISRAVLLAKVAHTLYISPVPPNLETYNTLLLGLMDAREPRLAERVLAAMGHSHIRVNEVSFAAALDLHRLTNNQAAFVRLVERMRGHYAGTGLARPDVNITEHNANRLLRVEFMGRDGPDTKVINLPNPTPMVFGALIKGVLKFGGFDAAMSICSDMGKEGWGLSMDGLTPLLHDCAERGNWDAGLEIWYQIRALKAKSENRGWMGRKHVKERIGVETFAAMLRLCLKCDQRELFQGIWAQAKRVWVNGKERGRLLEMVKNPKMEESMFRLSRKKSGEEVDDERFTHSAFDLQGLAPEDADARLWEAFESYTPDDEPHKHAVASFALPDMDKPPEEHSHEDTTPSPRPHQDNTPAKHEHILLEEQLHGTGQPDHELDDYERRERPMSVGG